MYEQAGAAAGAGAGAAGGPTPEAGPAPEGFQLSLIHILCKFYYFSDYFICSLLYLVQGL